MRWLQVALLVAAACWRGSSAQGGNLPTASNITWSSFNFKTLVDWTPKPTNYTYTLLLRNQYFQDWKKKCIFTKEATCDVSDFLQDTRATYEVRIVSEGKSAETEESIYKDGPTFSPYKQTIIGRPIIQNFTLNEDQSKLTIVVQDALSPYKNSNNAPLTVRDIFGSDFKYTVSYRKAFSTGKKQQQSSTNEIVINTDKGESYCFYVQASIPSRRENSVSEKSKEQCTSSEEREFDISILVAVGVAVALIVLIVVLSVILCTCRRGKKENSKETKPLNDV